MEPEAGEAGVENERWILVRHVFVFQCKLVIDGLRDLVLLPVSLIAALFSLLRKGPGPGPEFYDVLRLGRRSERWINLFGALEREAGAVSDDEKSAAKDFDEIVSRVESYLVDEYRKGGVTAQAKRRLDVALNSLQSATKRLGRGDEVLPSQQNTRSNTDRED
jgi:hypothetical protein